MQTIAQHPASPAVQVVTVPGRGRGVVALRALRAGERIERAPVIPLTHSELQHVQKTLLARYYFEWGEDHSGGAIALGYGSLYNHAYESNTEYEFHESELAIDFIARRDIAAGEELTINYNNTGTMALAPIRFD